MKKINLILFFTSCCISLAAQELTVFSGLFNHQYYQDSTQVKKSKIHFLMQQNDETSFYWKKSKTYSTIAKGSMVLSIASLISMNINKNSDKKIGNTTRRVVHQFGIYSHLIFSLVQQHYIKKAILKYNSHFDKNGLNKTTLKLNGKINSNGIGVSLEF